MFCTDIAKYFPLFQFAGEQHKTVPRHFCFGTFCPKVKARSVSTGPQPMGSTRKPSEAGCVGRGGARERVQFSPQGGNGTKRTLRRRGFGESPQQAFWKAILPPDGAKISSVFTLELLAKNASVATLALLAVSAPPQNTLLIQCENKYHSTPLTDHSCSYILYLKPAPQEGQ